MPEKTSVETLAWVSLILGVLSFLVLPVIGGIGAIIAGIKGKRRIDNSQGRKTGRGMAVTGETFGILNVALAVIVGVAILVRVLTSSGTLDFTQLKAGQCFTSLSGGDFPTSVNIVSCGKPHRVEVVGTFQSTDPGFYPSKSEFQAQANAACLPLARAYLQGSTVTGLHIYFVFPNQILWDSGTRLVVCGVQNADGSDRTGTVRAPGRPFFS